jgi:hypothetical protein
MMKLGRFFAWGACIAAIGYAIPQVLQVLGVLPDPLDRILIFAPSLALAPLFVLALAGAFIEGPAAAKGWRLSALCMALLYAALASAVYITQLSVVIPRELAGMPAVAGFACCGFREPMTGFDLLGYTYQSIATLLLAPTFRGAARWALLANAAFAPIVFLQIIWPALIWAAAPWLVVFPLAMALVARDLGRAARLDMGGAAS